MSAVYRVNYEVTGDGLAIAAQHYALVEARSAAGFAVAHKYGAVGFRPNHRSGIRQLLFAGKPKQPPPGFKYEAQEPSGNIACKPDKRTEIGKAALADMAAFEGMPAGEDLASALGYRVATAPMDGYKIYWPAAYRCRFPAERVFLDIPRQADDGWTPPAHLVEVPASTFMLAIEAHNAEANRATGERAAA